MLAQVTHFAQVVCLSVVGKSHRSCKVQLRSHRRSICVSLPAAGNAWGLHVLGWGELVLGLFAQRILRSGKVQSYSSFGESTPRMLLACCTTTSNEGQAEPIPGEKEALQQLTITMPCRAKPMFPSCAWSREWVML